MTKTKWESCRIYENLATDNYAKDGGKELFTKMNCVVNRIPIESLRIRHLNEMDLGKNSLAAVFSVVIWCAMLLF